MPPEFSPAVSLQGGPVNIVELKESIIKSLRDQGYILENNLISPILNRSKDELRKMNRLAVQQKLNVSGANLKRHETRLVKYIANGSEVLPSKIKPKLVLVCPKTEEELLFRYACLHWTIPVSSGYGRRLRFLVFDESNNKLIGLLGIGDPVFSLKNRDQWIGWNKENKKNQLYHLMDAFVLGAVPPYSSLLCGKLIALLALSNEVRKAFEEKYYARETIISKKTRKPYLSILTTTSALGKSSIYNRLRIDGTTYWHSVGYTQGSGEFHFSNGIYKNIREFVEEYAEPTAKNQSWGKGFRNKREVVKKCLSKIGLSQSLLYHGIKREIFVAPLGREALPFMRGEVDDPQPFNWSANQLSRNFMERWLIPRAERMPTFREYNRDDYLLWPKQ